MQSIRDRWRAGENTLGLWAAIANTSSAEALGQAGADYVCVDLQHGLVDYQAAVSMFQSVLLGGGTPIARAPWNEQGVIGKLLDAGAHGIIVPMVNTADEARAAVASCHYPPLGARSFGPSGVAPRTPGYFNNAREQVAVAVMVETAEALGNVDEIVAVEGVDAVYVGPADLSISLGLPPGNNDDSPVFVEALETILAACNKAGVVPGIHSSGQLTPKRLAAGFRMVTVATDLVSLRVALRDELKLARSGNVDGGDSDLY